MIARIVRSYLVIACLHGCTSAQDGPASLEDAAASLELADAVVLSAPAAPLAVDGGALLVHPAQAHTTLGFLGVPVFAGNGWALGTSTNPVIYPVQVAVGDVVAGANLYVQRTNGAAALVAQLQRVDNATGLRLPLSASVLENSGTTGSVVVPLPALTSNPLDGAYTVAITVAGLGVDGIVVGNAAVARSGIAQTTARTVVISPLGAAISSGWVVDFGGVSGTSRGFMRSTATGHFAVPLFLAEGDRFLSMTVSMYGDGVVDASIDVVGTWPDGSLELGVLGTRSVFNVPPTWTDYTVDLSDVTIVDGHSNWIEFYATGQGLRVGAVRLTYDRPN